MKQRKLSIKEARELAQNIMKEVEQQRKVERQPKSLRDDVPEFVPGDMAYCENGLLGLITKDKFILEKGVRKRVYIGISLEKESLGKPWQSVDPQWDGFILDYI